MRRLFGASRCVSCDQRRKGSTSPVPCCDHLRARSILAGEGESGRFGALRLFQRVGARLRRRRTPTIHTAEEEE